MTIDLDRYRELRNLILHHEPRYVRHCPDHRDQQQRLAQVRAALERA
jgi:hypothetical protein